MLIKFLLVVVPVLLGVAYLTLFERRVLAAAGRRVGPNRVGYGFLQPLADGLKLLTKDPVRPSAADGVLFVLAPVLSFGLALTNYSILPVRHGIITVECALLMVFMVSGLSVYGIILAGWSSNSRYAFLGALRASAQMISYEVSLGLILLTNCLVADSMRLTSLVDYQNHLWMVIPLLPGGVLFFLSSLAETNRPPFDLPEAEGELVAGYYVEYSSSSFALFFIAEYANIIFLSILWGVLFAGGFSPVIAVVVMFMFVWVRSAYPRYRYDQLMRLGWKCFLPLALSWFVSVWVLILWR